MKPTETIRCEGCDRTTEVTIVKWHPPALMMIWEGDSWTWGEDDWLCPKCARKKT